MVRDAALMVEDQSWYVSVILVDILQLTLLDDKHVVYFP